MRFLFVFFILVGVSKSFAKTGDTIAGGNCTNKCDCWIGFEGEQNYFLSNDAMFICGVTEGSPYRCSFENQIKWVTKGKPFKLEHYKSIGETACYYLKKN